jgi:hypothetical protein
MTQPTFTATDIKLQLLVVYEEEEKLRDVAAKIATRKAQLRAALKQLEELPAAPAAA